MEEDADYILPLILPQKNKPSSTTTSGTSNNAAVLNHNKNNLDNHQPMVTSGPIHQPSSISQQHQAPDEDDNRNHLAPSTTSILGSITNEELDYEPEENVGFTLQVTFHKGDGNVDQPKSTPRERLIQLSSHNIEAEATRCQEQLESTRLILSGLDAEAGQLERTGEQLRLAIKEEDQQLRHVETNAQQLVDELADCWRQAEQSAEELSRKALVAKKARTRRFETECVLRELQLNLCRRKLTLATARASSKQSGIEKTQNGDDMMEIVDEDDEMMEDDPILEDEQLREDETKIIALTKELEELSRNNTSAISEVEAAERADALCQRKRTEVETRIDGSRTDVEARRQKLAGQKTVLERHSEKLKILNKSRQRERLKEVELLQHQVLVEAARQLEDLERASRDLVNGR